MTVPALLTSSLNRLRGYMQGFYPDKSFPVEFWKIEDDDLFMEAMSYLPLMMGDVASDHWEDMPEGFRVAYPIFWLEDDYQVNGWTALSNAGDWLLPRAIAAFDRVGMQSESAALNAALLVFRTAQNDDEALEAAYKSVENRFSSDELKFATLLTFFRGNSQLFQERK